MTCAVHFLYDFNGLPKLLWFFGGALSVELIRHIYRLWKLKSANKIHEVLFFPDKAIACRDFFETVEGCPRKLNCSFSHETTNLRKLLVLIRSARKSVDICVYCISCFELADAVLQRHKVGVRVRVLSDHSMEEAHGSQNHRFMKDGIVVRLNRPPSLMHHKFVLIDDRMVAFGSFNWTSQAVTGNNESVLITEDPTIVRPFIGEFQRIWVQNAIQKQKQ